MNGQQAQDQRLDYLVEQIIDVLDLIDKQILRSLCNRPLFDQCIKLISCFYFSEATLIEVQVDDIFITNTILLKLQRRSFPSGRIFHNA